MENGTFLVLFQFSVAHGVLGYALLTHLSTNTPEQADKHVRTKLANTTTFPIPIWTLRGTRQFPRAINGKKFQSIQENTKIFSKARTKRTLFIPHG